MPSSPAAAASKEVFPHIEFLDFHFADSQLVVIWQDKPEHTDTLKVRSVFLAKFVACSSFVAGQPQNPQERGGCSKLTSL